MTQNNTVLEINVAATSTGENFPNRSVKSNIPMQTGLSVEFFNPAVRGDTQTITLTYTVKVSNQADPGVANCRHSATVICSISSSKGGGAGDSLQFKKGTTTKTLTLSGGESGSCTIYAGGNGSASVKVKVELKTF